MRHPVDPPMTVEQFLEWAQDQPGRYELAHGEVVAMAPERNRHAALKSEVLVGLRDALAAANLPCRAWPDGVSVRIDDHTVYELDAAVTCGQEVDLDAVLLPNPVIVVEVLSASTAARDMGAKLVDYFQLPGVRHYMIFRTEQLSVIHHRRRTDGELATRLIAGGRIDLSPPGIELDVEVIYRAAGIGLRE